MKIIGEVNEQSSAVVHLDFLDENDQEVQPSIVIWRLDDVFTDYIYAAGQTIIPSSPKVDIIIQPQWNDIKDDRNETEYRRLTINYQVTPTRIGTYEFKWAVRNLRKVP